MKDEPAGDTHSKRRIVAAAKDLFHQQGVRTTHVDEIAQAAGISPNDWVLAHDWWTKGFRWKG